MNQFLKFLCDNWRLIAGILVLVATLLVQLLKKKPVLNQFDTILLRVLEVVPQFIVLAEQTGSSGEIKKLLVMESVKKFIKDQFSITLTDEQIGLVDVFVEHVLSTPQKKER